jgi:hypothetical protein
MFAPDNKAQQLQGSMALSAMPTAASARRIFTYVAFSFVFTFLLFWHGRTTHMHPQVWLSSDDTFHSTAHDRQALPRSGKSSAAETFFDQTFSIVTPQPYPYAALSDACAGDEWHDDVYLSCTGIAMGLTTIVSQVKVCIRMAVEARVNLILPDILRRDETNLSEYHMNDTSVPLGWEKWFETAHIKNGLKTACPRMQVNLRNETDDLAIEKEVEITFDRLPAYTKYRGYFAVWRPFKAFFDAQFANLTRTSTSLVKQERAVRKPLTDRIKIVNIEPEFLLFRVTDDPTQRELAAWNDIGHLIRFRHEERSITHWVLSQLGGGPIYGVHFRVESDTIWTSFENQLAANLDALDKAWEQEQERTRATVTRGGKESRRRPVVYLACGDQSQAERFVNAALERGWDVTHKWRLASAAAYEDGDDNMARRIRALPFDMQGVIDLGVMLRSDFFFGITGSAFSTTVAHQRDSTGRYRGSSLILGLGGDGGARSHLMNDVDGTMFQCCF